MPISLLAGAQDVAGLNNTINTLIEEINAEYSGTLNSSNYADPQNAVTAAYVNSQPLLFQNTVTKKTINVGGITVLPGSEITSTIAVDNPTVALILSNAIIDGLRLNDNGQGSAIQMNSANCNNNILVNSIISSATSYTFLHNDAPSDTMIVAHNIMNAVADAIEFNHPTTIASNAVINGNVLTATQGFPLGIARLNSFVAMGNIIKQAGNTAVHIEDLNNGGVLVGLSAIQCQEDGFTIQVPVTMKGKPGPMTTGFMSLKNTSGSPSSWAGLTCINDGNGGVTQHIAMGNVLDTWGTAMVVSDSQDMLAEGNILRNAVLGAFTIKHGNLIGIQACENTPAFYQGQAGSLAEGFSSTTTVTSIISKSGSNFPGPALRRRPQVRIPVTIAHTGGSTQQWFSLCAAPTQFCGWCRIIMESGGEALIFDNLYKWDGTNLTRLYAYNSAGDTLIPMGIDVPNGGVTAEAFRVNGGNLQFGFTAGTAVTPTSYFEFDGTFQQNT